VRKTVIAAACSVAIAGGVVGTVDSAAAQTDAFTGTWTSTDFDGSNQTLTVGGSGTVGRHSVQLFDDSATSACEGAPARVSGLGTVDESTLVMTGTLTCMPGGNPLRFRISIAFEHDAATDTLTDEFGVVWERS
jgi:hypothetical protein